LTTFFISEKSLVRSASSVQRLANSVSDGVLRLTSVAARLTRRRSPNAERLTLDVTAFGIPQLSL